MTLLDLQGKGSNNKYKSSSNNQLNYLVIGVLIIGLIAAGAVFIPKFIEGVCYGPVCGVDNNDYDDSCAAFFAGIEVDYEGVCLRCSDSDGLNKYVFGEVIDNNGTLEDVCLSATELNEAVCEADVAKYVILNCGSGFSCNEGACIETCVASQEELNIYERGNVILGNSSNESDVCISDTVVKKYYCENNTINYSEIDCGLGYHCYEGACQENPCEDSDEGNDIFVKGTISKGEDSFTDVCLSENELKEYYCEDGNINYEEVLCPSGYECNDGLCQELTCLDSDFGINQYIKGTVKLGSETYTDSCYSKYDVLEYYCDDDIIKTIKLTCASDSECVDGVCQVVECESTITDSDDSYVKHNIAIYEDVEIKLRVDEVAELKGGYLLEYVSGTDVIADFKLYQTLQKYEDSDEMCSFSIDKDDSLSKYCGKTVTRIEITNSSINDVSFKVGEVYLMQYYDYEKRITDWTDSHVCDDDDVYYDYFNMKFLPYIATNEGFELNLYNKKILLFEEEATIKEIDLIEESFRFSFLGKTYTIKNGDSFTYENHDYKFYLNFVDNGLERIEIELD